MTMRMNDIIIYPTVDLFLYDLRESLGQPPAQLDRNWDNFKHKLPAELQGCLKRDNSFDPESVDLLNKRFYEFGNPGDTYQGFYYPVRMSDTYGLLLDCSINDTKKPYPAKSIKRVKEEIDRRLGGATPNLGQTWLISGQLVDPAVQSAEDIAKICYKAVLPLCDWRDNFQGTGTVFGGRAFELWHYESLLKEMPENSDRDRSSNIWPTFASHHVIIVLYPNAKSAQAGAELHCDWMQLFAYRAKILWAYAQTRQLKQWLKQDSIAIQDCLQEIRGDRHKSLPLPQLQSTLNQARSLVPDYTIDIGYLADQERTMAINLYNYQRRIKSIAEEATSSEFAPVGFPPPDLAFLANFSDDVAEKYLLQVRKDYENLAPGLQRLEFAIATIRSLVEVDRADRDRRFQTNVTVLGWGLAAAGLVVSLSAQFPYVIVPVEVLRRETENRAIATVELQPSVSASWDAAIYSAVYSIGAAGAVMAIAWLWMRLRK